MVTDAVTGDFNEDGTIDIIVVGEYTPIQVILGKGAGFDGVQPLPNTEGWYYSLTKIDLDDDGDLDLVAGNVGLNTPYQVDADRWPVRRGNGIPALPR